MATEAVAMGDETGETRAVEQGKATGEKKAGDFGATRAPREGMKNRGGRMAVDYTRDANSKGPLETPEKLLWYTSTGSVSSCLA